MKGVYQHCGEKHLHRYLAEFDFRYSNRVRLGVDDVERTDRALKGIVGKRLTYRYNRQLRGHMGKAGEKQKQKKPSKKEQYERFQQTARDHGIDEEESAKTFEKTFAKIIPPRRAKSVRG